MGGEKKSTTEQQSTQNQTTAQNQQSTQTGNTLSNSNTSQNGTSTSAQTGSQIGTTTGTQTGTSAQNTANNQVSSIKKWTGNNAATADKLLAGISDFFAGSNPSADAASAYNNGIYATPINALTQSNYDRNLALSNNAEINSVASGDHLDPNSDPYFQKNLAEQVDKSKRAFATSLDSVNGSFQNGGTADSSMRYRKTNNMLDDQSTNVNDMVNTAYSTQRDKAISEMTQANSLLNTAGAVGNQYQTIMQQMKDGSLATYMKLYGLDASKQTDIMQYLNLISEPTQTTQGTGTSAGTTASNTAGTSNTNTASNATGTTSNNTITQSQVQSLMEALANQTGESNTVGHTSGTTTQTNTPGIMDWFQTILSIPFGGIGGGSGSGFNIPGGSSKTN